MLLRLIWIVVVDDELVENVQQCVRLFGTLEHDSSLKKLDDDLAPKPYHLGLLRRFQNESAYLENSRD